MVSTGIWLKSKYFTNIDSYLVDILILVQGKPDMPTEIKGTQFSQRFLETLSLRHNVHYIFLKLIRKCLHAPTKVNARIGF